jgi:hypothetical protein
VALSASTTAVLQELNSAIEIRFYRSLDLASVAASEQAFAGRVEQLLAAFERRGGGKIKVTRYRFQPNSGVEHAAEADGIKPFNLDKGDACFLGLAVVGRGTKESLARLLPEWEPALEFDLARAIARAAEAGLQAQPLAVAPRTDAVALEEVRRAIPNLDSVSLEAGTRLLREAAASEFARAAQELEARLRQAEQNLVQAQSNHSEAEEQAALKQLQQVQAEQADKLKQIAARSQAQIQALTRLKADGH